MPMPRQPLPGVQLREVSEMKYTQQTEKTNFKKYVAIFCFTCNREVASKRDLRPTHMGHEVHYVGPNREIDE